MENDEDNEETSLDIIIKSRLHLIINKIKNLKKEAEIFCKEGNDDKEEVQKAQICASKLENMIKRFTSELNEYFRTSNHPSSDEIAIADMSSAQLDSEEVLAELRCRLSMLADKNKGEKLQSQAFSAKLPTLTLPVFRGDVLEWSGFWDIYKSNIHDRNIPDVDKLLYLKSTLQEEPRRIIDGLETTNTNYAVAIKILTDRYGKQSQIIDAHYSTLSKVKIADTSIGECRTTLNEVERHLRVLQSLGENTDHNHLRFLITEKFPGDLIYEMKMKMKDYTVGEMRKQLEVIITAREEADKIRQDVPTKQENHTVETLHVTHKDRGKSTSKDHNSKNRFIKREGYKNEKENSERSQRMEPSCSRNRCDTSKKRKYEPMRDRERMEERDTHKRRKLSCIFCNDDHYSDKCQEYKTVEERKAKLGRRCFNCLSDKHLIRLCEVSRECVYCHMTGRHHRALCPEKFKPKQEDATIA